MTDRASDPAEYKDPLMNPPGTQGQPGEFIDTPENQPGDQGEETLAEGMKVKPSDLHRDPEEIDRSDD